MSDPPRKDTVLGIVGPCSAGKSTLIGNLQEMGYICRHIAQEHSYVPDMWLRIVNPAALIYLDVTYQTSLRRRHLNLSNLEFEEQNRRLAHARQNAHIYVNTDQISPEQVYQLVLKSLQDLAIQP
jgi:guanylate kinase